MTDPLPPGAGTDADDDAIAELLLAAAVAAAPAPDMPAKGDPANEPDMGDTTVTAPTTPAPPTAPTTPPAPAPATPAPPPPTEPAPPATAGPQNGAHGFPESTPVADMTTEQAANYWKYQARKHEQRVKEMADYDQLKQVKSSYDALVEASQTEQERAVAEARRQGHAEAMTAAGGRLVEAYVHAAAAGRLDQERVNALLDGMDRSKFLNSETGEVDTDRVTAFVHALAPAASPAAGTPAPPAAQQQPGGTPAAPQAPEAPPRAPDFGQGHRNPVGPRGLDAGREIARARFAKAKGESAQTGPLAVAQP